MILIPFAFDESLFNKSKGSISDEDIESLLVFWYTQGVFYLRKNKPEYALMNLANMSGKLKSTFKHLVKRYNGYYIDSYKDVDISVCETLENAVSEYDEIFMALIAGGMNSKSGLYSNGDTQLQINTIRNALSRQIAIEQRGHVGDGILAGEELESVWSKRFEPLITNKILIDEVFKVRIIDRYCFTNDSPHNSGLKFILSKIARTEREIDNLTIFTAFDGDNENPKYHLDEISVNADLVIKQLKEITND
jgi:hypothetical protein